MRLLLAALFILLSVTPACALPGGKRAIIVLTYDDALASHLDVAIPQLNAAGFDGTFFLDGDITPADMLRWRAAAAEGHELGNHSVFHPCPRGMLAGRDQYATDTYSPASMSDEIAVMNAVLFGIDGETARTLSYPCSQTLAGGEDYVDTLKARGLIRYARTGGDPYNSVVTDLAALDLFRVPSNGPVDEPDGAALIAYAERVRDAGGMGVLQFHGVGGDYLKVSAEAHQALVTWLVAHPDVWVLTFQDAMDYVASEQRR